MSDQRRGAYDIAELSSLTRVGAGEIEIQDPRNQGLTRTMRQRISRSGEVMVSVHCESVADANGRGVNFMLGDGGEAQVEVFSRGRELGGAGVWQLVNQEGQHRQSILEFAIGSSS